MASIRLTLGRLPSGRVVERSTDEVSRFLRDNYISSDAERMRRRDAMRRLDLYKDRADESIIALIERLFDNPKVKSLRKSFAAIAAYQNVSKRITNEISRVYSQPATRLIEADQDRYLLLQRITRLDRKMRLANRYTNLLNETVIWPRIDPVSGRVEIRIVTPDRFFAVASPTDPLDLVAIIIDRHPTGKRVRPTDPHWLVATDTEFFWLDKDGRVIEGSWVEHGLGRIPMVLAHREEPDDSLLNPSPGGDIVDAHLAVALLNVLLLKGQKSGTRVPYVSGDLSSTPEGQPMDEETIVEFGEGVQVSTLDLGVSPDHVIATTRSILGQIAANYGIPLSVFELSYQTSSGFEIELKRSGLREIRNDQILDYRAIEFDLADLMSRLLTTAAHPLAFSVDGWRIDFGELETPRDPLQRLAYWKELRSMGLANTIEFYRELNPEATNDQATAAIEANAQIEAARIRLFRSLNLSPEATIENPGQGPVENGSAGGQASGVIQ